MLKTSFFLMFSEVVLVTKFYQCFLNSILTVRSVVQMLLETIFLTFVNKTIETFEDRRIYLISYCLSTFEDENQKIIIFILLGR